MIAFNVIISTNYVLFVVVVVGHGVFFFVDSWNNILSERLCLCLPVFRIYGQCRMLHKSTDRIEEMLMRQFLTFNTAHL